jgi:hypothetical protein
MHTYITVTIPQLMQNLERNAYLSWGTPVLIFYYTLVAKNTLLGTDGECGI